MVNHLSRYLPPLLQYLGLYFYYFFNFYHCHHCYLYCHFHLLHYFMHKNHLHLLPALHFFFNLQFFVFLSGLSFSNLSLLELLSFFLLLESLPYKCKFCSCSSSSSSSFYSLSSNNLSASYIPSGFSSYSFFARSSSLCLYQYCHLIPTPAMINIKAIYK